MEEKEESANHYEPDMLEILYKRRENHLNGQSKSYSVEEAIDSIKTANKGNGQE